jgi:hypothetical protein
MFGSRTGPLAVSVLLILLTTLPADSRLAFAQESDDEGPEERDLTFIGQVRVRPEFRDNADFDGDRPDRQRFIGQRTRLGLEARVNPRVEGRVVAQDTRIWGVDGTTLDTGDEIQSLDLLEGYADLRWIWDLPLDIRLGRQQLSYGRERLVGDADFHPAARTFDAYRFHFVMGALLLDIFSAKLVDTNPPGSPGLPVESDQDRNFSGAYFSREGGRLEALDLYWLRDIDKTSPSTGEIKRHTFGVLGRTHLPADLTLEIEYAHQRGEAGPALDIDADMLVTELSYTRKEARELRAALAFEWASGDRDPTDGELATFDQLFPTAHRHLGAMDYVGRRNIQDIRGQFGAKLTGRISGLVDFHIFRLARPEDAWFDAAGGVTQAGVRVFGSDPSRREYDLGQELDLLFRFHGFTGAAIEGGYSRFFAGNLIRLGGAPADDSDWAYFQVKIDL